MDFLSTLYLQILNLIKEIILIFGGEIEVIQGMIDEFNAAGEETEEAPTV